MNDRDASHDLSQDKGIGRLAVWLVGGVGLVVVVLLTAVFVLRLFAKFML